MDGALLLTLLLPLKAALFFLNLVWFQLRTCTAFLTAPALTSYSGVRLGRDGAHGS